jgi:hypothetical protein
MLVRLGPLAAGTDRCNRLSSGLASVGCPGYNCVT